MHGETVKIIEAQPAKLRNIKMHGGTAKIMKDVTFNCLGITLTHIEEYVLL